MAREFFKNLPNTTTPLTAPRLNGLLDGDEAMGNIVVDSITSKNIFNENQILSASGWSKNSSGYYTGGISDLITLFRNNNFGSFEANTQYTFQWTGYLTSGSNVRFLITYTDNTTSQIAYINSSTSALHSGTTTAGKTISRVDIDAGSNGTLFIKNIQWEKGATATDYALYQGLGYVRGSNANGNYIKYEDGTLIQWDYLEVTDQAISSQYGGTSLYIGQRTIIFPIAFVGKIPSVQCSQFRWGTGGSWGSAGASTLTGVTLIGYDFFPRAVGTNCYIGWIAIGRWK